MRAVHIPRGKVQVVFPRSKPLPDAGGEDTDVRTFTYDDPWEALADARQFLDVCIKGVAGVE